MKKDRGEFDFSNKMKNRYFMAIFMIIMWVFLLVNAECGGKMFRVEDYGAASDGTSDASAAVRKAIEAAITAGPGSIVLFGEGQYRLSPEKRSFCLKADTNSSESGLATEDDNLSKKVNTLDIGACFYLSSVQDFTIQGQGGKTELLITSPLAELFRVKDCKNLCFKDFVVDYDPLPFTQGKIVGVDTEAGTFDLKIDKGFPSLTENWFYRADAKWGMIFDRGKRKLKTGSPSAIFIKSWMSLPNHFWRMQLNNKSDATFFEDGDRFVHLARTNGKGVFFLDKCRDVVIENVSIYSGSGAAVISVGSENGIVIKELQVRCKASSGRLISTNADGVHCQLNRKGPLIENCFFEGMADDGINIYAAPNIIKQVLSPIKLRVTSVNWIRKQDLLQIIDPRRGVLKCQAIVIDVQDDVITLDHAVEKIQAGKNYLDADTIYDLSACGEDYIIRNNNIIGIRGRGIVAQAVNGIIENNKIQEVSGQGIVISNTPDWPEGPFPKNINIRNNTFIDVGFDSSGISHAAIFITAFKLGWGQAEERAIHGIAIVNNQIINPPGKAIFVGQGDDIRIVGNSVQVMQDAKNYGENKGIVLVNCSNVIIDKFSIKDDQQIMISALEIGHLVEHGEAGVKISGLKANLNKSANLIVDNRK